MPVDLLKFLSQDQFRCLDFWDHTLVESAQRKAAIVSMDRIHKVFLSAIGHRHITRPQDKMLRNEIRNWVDWRLLKVYSNEWKRAHLVDMAATFMEFLYPKASFQLKMCVGVVTAAVMVIDDCMSDRAIRAQVRGFSFRYLRGHVQPDDEQTRL